MTLGWALRVRTVLFPVLFALTILTAFFQKRHIVALGEGFPGGHFLEAGVIAIYLSDLFFLGAVFLWLASFSAQGTKIRPRAFLFLIVFVGWALLRSQSAPVPLMGVYAIIRVLQGILLALLLRQIVLSQRFLRGFLLVLVLGGVFQASIGILQVLQERSVGLSIVGESVFDLHTPGVAKVDLREGGKILRAYGTLPHANILGGVLFFSLMGSFMLYQYVRGYPLQEALVLVAYGVQVLGSLFTFSRSALIALMGLLVFFLIGKDRPLRFMSLFGTGILFLSFVSFPILREGWESRLYPPASDASIAERQLLSFEAWEIFQEHPFLGVGPGNYISTLLARVPYGTTLFSWQYEYPHNVFFVIGLEYGIIGFFLLSVVLHSLFFSRIPKRMLVLACILTLPLLMLDHYLWTTQQGRILFWSFLGVFSASITLQSKSLVKN